MQVMVEQMPVRGLHDQLLLPQPDARSRYAHGLVLLTPSASSKLPATISKHSNEQ